MPGQYRSMPHSLHESAPLWHAPTFQEVFSHKPRAWLQPREIQMVSPMARQESMRASAGKSFDASRAARRPGGADARVAADFESATDIIAQGLDDSAGFGDTRLRLDASARRTDPLNSR